MPKESMSERWRELCQRVINEKDPAKLAELTKEMSCLLDQQRIKKEEQKNSD